MKGWFDAFRSEGGPTLYSYSNRSSVNGDIPSLTLYVVFFTLFIAFIIIFPGVRKERFTTFTSVVLSLFVGFTILVTKYGSSWHVAETDIMSYYRAFSREKLSADIGVHIGLSSFNVTLQGLSTTKNDSISDQYRGDLQEDIDFNERFHWITATNIQEEFREALVKGLPYPILTVVEYFNMDDEGFCWMRNYRQAGYYCSILLWASFASWLLMNLLLVVVPRYGAYQMVITGLLMLTTNLLYYLLIPFKPLVIRFEDHILMFKFGWCFWLVLVCGGLCCLVGGIIAIVDLLFPHKFSTILEVDFDTPYDRHIIIEESHDTRKKKGAKRSLEEPEELGFGKKILRTLSKREKTEEVDNVAHFAHHLNGYHNRGFELDPPKSPWRFQQHLMFDSRGGPDHHNTLVNAMAKNPALAKLAAPTPTKSPKSVSFRRQSRLAETFTPGEPRFSRSDSKDSTVSSSSTELPTNFQSQFQSQKPVQRTDSQQSGSSTSSFGLSLLSRTQSKREIPSSIILNPHHLPLTSQISSPASKDKIPLSRLYNHQLPRASLSSSDGEGTQNSRRSSDSSHVSHVSSSRSRTDSSVFSSHSNSFDYSKQKRIEPDGHEQLSAKSSREAW